MAAIGSDLLLFKFPQVGAQQVAHVPNLDIDLTSDNGGFVGQSWDCTLRGPRDTVSHGRGAALYANAKGEVSGF